MAGLLSQLYSPPVKNLYVNGKSAEQNQQGYITNDATSQLHDVSISN
jgi:hypothetical protein